MGTVTDLEKLRVLLPHWVEHNAEHAAEFHTTNLDFWAAEWNSTSEAEKAPQGLISAPEACPERSRRGAFQLQTGISNPRPPISRRSAKHSKATLGIFHLCQSRIPI